LGANQVSVALGFGTWGLGGDAYGSITQTEAIRLLETAYDCGIRIFDTSPSYGAGRAEEILGVFQKKYCDIQIFTKVGMLPHKTFEIPHDFSTKNLTNTVETSLKRLKLEALSLLQLHSPQLDYLDRYPNLLEDLSALIESGKVAKVGISLRSPNFLDSQFLDFGWKSFQFNFSLLDQRILASQSINLGGFREAIRIARTPLHFGFLTGEGVSISELGSNHHLAKWSRDQLNTWANSAAKFKALALSIDLSLEGLALQFLKASSVPTLVIPGMMDIQQLKKNMKDFNLPKIDDSVYEEIIQIYGIIEDTLKVDTPFRYTNKSQ
jgi:aryl-alcohol dehydrogenase-like predicted oxidoreductase